LDLDQALIRVESTAVASLKTVDSRGEVPIDPGIVGLLRGYRAQATGVFVIGATGEDATPKPWGRQYRASRVFERLYAWLRKNGVTAQKPLHTLRKELGALITSEFGIYAASRVLRHSDVATTARHYADQKTRATIKVSEWLTPGNVTPMNPKPGAKSGKASKMRQPRRTKAAA
jgi:integrase